MSPRVLSPAGSEPRLVPISDPECRAIVRDGAPQSSLRQAIMQSVAYLQKLPPQHSFAALDRRVTASELLDVVNGLAAILERGGDLEHDVCERFRMYRAELPGRLLITGYYQPEVAASRIRTERFRYPLYRTPDDLIDVNIGEFAPGCGTGIAAGRVQDGKLVPYYSRAEIDGGALAGRDYEIAWLDDPVEVFFLHVQGSARLRFADGVHMDVSYSGSNGRPYTSIGRVLIQQGKMAAETVSLFSLKDYLRAYPEEQGALFATNQRYIFFRTVVAGPIGRLELPLTAGRSLAADARVYPPGALVFLRVPAPATPASRATTEAVSRFALIQDGGAAITGADHIDVFWGSGSTAEAIAGDMRSAGEVYFLLPR